MLGLLVLSLIGDVRIGGVTVTTAGGRAKSYMHGVPSPSIAHSRTVFERVVLALFVVVPLGEVAVAISG